MNQVIIVVNKMDNVQPQPWAAERYYEIEASMRQLLVQEMNFADHLVRAIPVSGFTAQNIVSLDEDCPLKAWYTGPTLVELMDAFRMPPRQLDRPFRAAIYRTPASRGEAAGDISKGKYVVDVAVMQGAIAVGRSAAFYEHLGAPAPVGSGAKTGESSHTMGKSSNEDDLKGEEGESSATAAGSAGTSMTVATVVGISKVNDDDGAGLTSVAELSAGERGSLQLSNRCTCHSVINNLIFSISLFVTRHLVHSIFHSFNHSLI